MITFDALIHQITQRQLSARRAPAPIRRDKRIWCNDGWTWAGVRRLTNSNLIHRSHHIASFSYLMDVYGRLRVREYNTLHRAIRKSSWGPVRCNIALHLHGDGNGKWLVSIYPEETITSPTCLTAGKDHARSSTYYTGGLINYLKITHAIESLTMC